MPEPDVPTMTAIVCGSTHRHTIDDRAVAIGLANLVDLIIGRFRWRSHLDEGVEDDGGSEGETDGRQSPEQHKIHGGLADALEHEDAEAAPPMSAAMVAIPIFSTGTMRMPVSMTGKARGSCTATRR